MTEGTHMATKNYGAVSGDGTICNTGMTLKMARKRATRLIPVGIP